MGLDNPVHILILLLIILLVFGAKRLPEIGKSLGEGMRGFKDSLSGQPSQQTSLTATPAQAPPAPAPASRCPWPSAPEAVVVQAQDAGATPAPELTRPPAASPDAAGTRGVDAWRPPGIAGDTQPTLRGAQKPRGRASARRKPTTGNAGGGSSYRASASSSALRFSVAVSKCFLVSLTTTGSASLTKPRLSPR